MAQTLTGIAAFRQACKDAPCDLDARSILADALEDAGDPEAAFQREILARARMIATKVNQRLHRTPDFVCQVGIVVGPKHVRIFTERSNHAARE